MATIAKTKQPVRMPRFGHRVDKTDPILRGCVGWWPLNDGAGSKAVDMSANGNDGTLSVRNLWSSQEKGVLFDGSTREYVSGTGVHLGSSSGTLSLWFKADAEVNGGYLLSLPYVSASSNGFDIRAITGGCRVDLATSSGFKTLSYTTQNVQDGSIYYIAATYDGSDIVLYVNGNQVATTTHTGTINQQANGEFTINNFSPLRNNKADGYYQNVRVYDRALSASEVSRLYSEPWAGLEPLSPFSFFSVPTAGAPLAVFYNHYKNQGII